MKIKCKFLAAGLLLTLCLLVTSTAQALPQGSEIVHGDASIDRQGLDMTVNQGTDKLIINWQEFSIGTEETVLFRQPNNSSVALNRVIGDNLSVIDGRLSANGHVFLINPQGVLFGAGARVSTGGLVASSLAMSDDDFLADRYTFSGTDRAGAIVNDGQISVSPGATVALIGPEVRNTGRINAPHGTVALGAGNRVTLRPAGEVPLSFTVDEAALGALAANDGTIIAEGGHVVLSAQAKDALLDTVVSNAGVIEAHSMENDNGTIVLHGGDSGVTDVSGTLDASGRASGETGGTIHVTGDKVALVDDATVDVSGDAGGGTVLIGGDVGGENPDIMNASGAFIGHGATITADAFTDGDGGKVVIWSDDATRFYGAISARGGASSGDGGFVETSGGFLDARGTVDASAVNGRAGEWLLDPYNIEINSSGNDSNISDGPNFVSQGDDSVIDYRTIETALQSNNVTISTGGSGTQAGDIRIGNSITWATDHKLTLKAHNDIVTWSVLVNSGEATITLRADSDGDGNGTVNFRPLGMGIGGSVSNALGDTVILYNPLSYDDAATKSDTNGNPYAAFMVAGDVTAYMLVNDVNDLQAMQDNTRGFYALGKDIDASETAVWNDDGSGNYLGFETIGTGTSFTGTLDGRGHVIDGLYVNRTTAGLFGGVSTGEIRDLGLINVDISGVRAGALASLVWDTGSITDVYSTGTVTGLERAGVKAVGGLVGTNQGMITRSYSTATVSGVSNVGGLVGQVRGGEISYSYSTGDVKGSGFYVGGLVGRNWFQQPHMQPDGPAGTIHHVYSTGQVNGDRSVGGLVGLNYGDISEAYSTGSVTGTTLVGGLVGNNAAYSEGASSITNAYSTGDVSGITWVGGLVGLNSSNAHIGSTFSVGHVPVSNSDSVGGLIGANSGTVTDSYWDTETSGESSSDGGTGMKTDELQQALPTGFDAAAWDIVKGKTYPYLTWTFDGGVPRIVSGTVYAESGEATLGAGIGVSALRGGTALTSAFGQAHTAADGSYMMVINPTLTGAGGDYLVYLTGGEIGNAFYEGGTGPIHDVDIYGATLRFSTGAAKLSEAVAPLEAALGGHGGDEFLFTFSPSGEFNLESGANLRIDATASTFDLDQAIPVDGRLVLDSSRTVTQSAAIQAGELELVGAASYYLHTQNNSVTTLSGDAESVIFRDDDGFDVAGLTMSGYAILESKGNVTQSGAINAKRLGLAGRGGIHTLTNAGNDVDELHGNTGSVNFRNDGDFTVGANSNYLKVATDLTLRSNGIVEQDAKIEANTLRLLGASGQYRLNNSLNDVAKLSGDTFSVGFRNRDGFDVEGLKTVGFTTISANNSTVTQSGSIEASTLHLYGTSTYFDLDHEDNAVRYLHVEAGSLSFRNDGDFNVSASGLTVTGDATLRSSGAVTQSGAIAANHLQLLGSGGNYQLHTADNSVATISADTGSVAFRDDHGFKVAGLKATGDATFVARSTVKQSGGIQVGGTLALNGSGGIYVLTNSVNDVQALSGTTGRVHFRNDDDFVIAGLNVSGTSGLTTSGTVTQTGAITANILDLSGAGGNYDLTHEGNAVTKLSVNTGSIDFRSNGDFEINGMTTTGDATLHSAGTVTQTGGITVDGLHLLGDNGHYSFGDMNNTVSTLSGNTGSVTFSSNSGFEVGALTTTEDITFSSGGTVTQTGAIKAESLNLNGAGGIFELTHKANDVDALGGDTGSVTFNDSDGYRITRLVTAGGTALWAGSPETTGGTTPTKVSTFSHNAYTFAEGDVGTSTRCGIPELDDETDDEPRCIVPYTAEIGN